MALTPDEIRAYALQARRGRYAKVEVDHLLHELFANYDVLWSERTEIGSRVAALEAELGGFRAMEQELRDGILTGQRAAAEVVREAERERERILETARTQGEDLSRAAHEERGALEEDVERLRTLDSELESNYRAFLYAALHVLENRESPPAGAPSEPPQPEEASPGRQKFGSPAGQLR